MNMNRYQAYEFSINGAIVIDTKEHKWAFYNTNIHNQVYNLDEPFKKISKQRINGLIKRLNKSFYDSMNGYVVDRHIYNLIFTEEQRDNCRRSVHLDEKEFIASSNDLKDILMSVGKHFLDEGDDRYEETIEVYNKKIKEFVA